MKLRSCLAALVDLVGFGSLAAGVGACLLALAVAGSASAGQPRPDRAPVARLDGTKGAEALASLPPAAQAMISATLGRDDRSYHVATARDGLRAENPAQRLNLHFRLAGVDVRAGVARLGLTARALGHGEALRPLAPVRPS